MIYLSIGFCKPMVILFSITLLPLSIACGILVFLDYRIELLIVTALLILAYVLIILVIYKCSKSKAYYLYVDENNLLSIVYPNISKENEIKLNIDCVVKIEYYSILSIKSWFLLHNYVCPQCAYITYFSDGKKSCKLMGYPSLKRLRELCTKSNITLDIK